MKNLVTQVLIIGGGAAGLNAALNLKTKDVILIEKNSSNSQISPWNLMTKPKKELREKMLETGNKMNDTGLLEVFLNNYKISIDDLRKIGIKLRKSYIGLVPAYKLPGLAARKIFLRELEKKKVNILKGEVKNFLIDKNKKIVGVEVFLFNTYQKVRIFFNYLILAAGGLSGFFEFFTGSKDVDGSILSLCYEAGLKMRDLEFFMFHPFLVYDKRLPQVLLSGEILTKMEFEDDVGREFLSKEVASALKNNEHHFIFDRMVREFYLQSLKSRILGKLICSDTFFEKYKKENGYGFIFSNFKKAKTERIEFHPAFHFSIGGLIIDKKARTSQKNIYAAGEITGGLHGSNRIGGLSILEALVFSKIAALDINKNINKKMPVIPKKIRKIGYLGSLDYLRKKIWDSLGPVKKKEDLNNLLIFLKNRKKQTSQEKLIQKIVEICLQRKESVGTFFREDLKLVKSAKSSFLLNKKIIFR